MGAPLQKATRRTLLALRWRDRWATRREKSAAGAGTVRWCITTAPKGGRVPEYSKKGGCASGGPSASLTARKPPAAAARALMDTSGGKGEELMLFVLVLLGGKSEEHMLLVLVLLGEPGECV